MPNMTYMQVPESGCCITRPSSRPSGSDGNCVAAAYGGVCVGHDTKLERCKSSYQVFAEPKVRQWQGRRREAASEGSRRQSDGVMNKNRI